MSPIPSMNATRSNSGSYKNQAPGIALTPHLIPCCKLHPPAIEDDHHRGDCCFRVIDENSSIPDTSSTVSTSMHSDSLEKDDDLIRRSRRPKDKHQQEPADRGGTDSDKHCDSKQLTSIRSDPTTNTTSSTTTTTATTTFRQSADELMRYERKYSRYCHVVSQSYQKMGIWYLQMEDPTRSVIMHRASYRIDVFLYGATTNGALSVYFRQALTNRGVPEDDFITIQKCVTDSVHLEMRGDMLRQFGMAQRAAHEYQKAVKVEESAFGRENPCLATLWRKLVCLAVVIRADTSHWSKDIDEMDRLDGPWLKQQYNSKAASVEGAEKTDNRDGRRRRSGGILPANVGRAIEQGDACYQAMDFAQAVGRYSHAVAIHKSRRPSSRSTSSSSRDRNRSGKDRSSRSRSRSVSKEVPHHGSKSPRRRGTRGETRPTNNPKSAEEKVDNEHAMQEIKKLLNDSKFAKKKRDGVVASTVLHSDSNQPRMEQRSMEAPSPPPSSSSSLPVHHQTVISTSTRRVKRNHSNSTSTRSSSMYQAIRNYVDPQRPKSDSHVTKLAKKVVRKTSKHIRKTLGGSSIHGGTANRPSKSTTKEDGDDEDDDAESLTEPSRPKSESYAYLASPPMTPLVNNTTAKLSDILKVSSPTTSSNHHRGSVEFYGEDEDEDDGHYFYQPSTSTTSHRRYK